MLQSVGIDLRWHLKGMLQTPDDVQELNELHRTLQELRYSFVRAC
jgi:hypothetical protein